MVNSFSTSKEVSINEGIPLKLKTILDYGNNLKYGIFELNNEEITLKMPLSFNENDNFTLKLTYGDLKARDTHFDIILN